MKNAKIVLCLRPTLKGSVVWVDGYAKPWCAIEMRMTKDKTIFKLTRMVGDDGYIHDDSVPTVEEFEADPLVVLTLPEGLEPFQLFGMFAHGFMRDYTKIEPVISPLGDLK